MSVGRSGLTLRGDLVNYVWTWDEIALDVGHVASGSDVTLHYLADGRLGLNIGEQLMRLYTRPDFVELVEQHGREVANRTRLH